MDTASSYWPVRRDTPAEVSSRAIMGSFSLARNFCHSGSSSASGSSLRPKSDWRPPTAEEGRPRAGSTPMSSSTCAAGVTDAEALLQRVAGVERRIAAQGAAGCGKG